MSKKLEETNKYFSTFFKKYYGYINYDVEIFSIINDIVLFKYLYKNQDKFLEIKRLNTKTLELTEDFQTSLLYSNGMCEFFISDNDRLINLLKSYGVDIYNKCLYYWNNMESILQDKSNIYLIMFSYKKSNFKNFPKDIMIYILTFVLIEEV